MALIFLLADVFLTNISNLLLAKSCQTIKETFGIFRGGGLDRSRPFLPKSESFFFIQWAVTSFDEIKTNPHTRDTESPNVCRYLHRYLPNPFFFFF